MPSISVTRRIAAPVEKVFGVVADIERFSEAIPQIVEVQILSETRRGVGTRFRETRRMGKRLATTELEVTEHDPPRRVRIVSDTAGTVWDTVFTTTEAAEGTELRMVMEARAYRLLPRLLNPLLLRMIARAVEGDMDAVKAHCER